MTALDVAEGRRLLGESTPGGWKPWFLRQAERDPDTALHKWLVDNAGQLLNAASTLSAALALMAELVGDRECDENEWHECSVHGWEGGKDGPYCPHWRAAQFLEEVGPS